MIQPRDPYSRPNSPWVCGGSSSIGQECPGPVQGRCAAQPKCRPIRMGSEWVATLDPRLGECPSGPLPDGQCCQGPATCAPRPSWRRYRSTFVWCCVALTFALLCWGLAPSQRAQFLAPGKLCSHHAQILNQDGGPGCAACHAAGDPSQSVLLGSLTGSGHHSTSTQSMLCLKCHAAQLTSGWELVAHNVDPTQLREKTALAIGIEAMSIPVKHTGIACATCHREHQGPDGDLNRMTDRQCQTCHADNYECFETDHVEFTASYPARRRSKIAFDHVRHMSIHFADKNRTFDCRSCHVSDARHNVQLLAGYERSCQECHQEQIVGGESLTFLTLPWIDLEALRKHQFEIPAWPATAGKEFDGQVAPLLKVILSSNDEIRQALQQLPAQFQFSDVDVDNPRQVELAARIALEIGLMFDEWAVDPIESLRVRMSQALGCSPDDPSLERWLTTIPREELHRLKHHWFATSKAPTVAENELAAGALKSPQSEDSSPPGIDNVSAAVNSAQATAGDLGDQWLARNPLAEIDLRALITGEHAQAENLPAPDKPLDSPTGTDPETALMPDEATSQMPNGAVVPTENLAASLPVPSSGWQVDSQSLSIIYRPQAHADESIQSLLELVSKSERKESSTVVGELFRELTKDVAAGTCAKCHTIDRESESHVIHWRATYRDPTVRDFTVFSHAPHLVGPTQSNCSDCHILDGSRSNAHMFASDNPYSFQSNFATMKVGLCATCHREGGTSNSCTTCHSYHVGSRVISAD